MEPTNLTIYRRHEENCKFAIDGKRHNILCKCPLWVDGTRGGKRFRRSLKTRSMDVAKTRTAKLEAGETVAQVAPTSPTVERAIESYLADCEIRKIEPSTIRGYAQRLATLKLHLASVPVRLLTEDQMYAWRAARAKQAPGSTVLDLKVVRQFLKYARLRKWMDNDPTAALQRIDPDTEPTLPFTEDEVERMLTNCKNLQPFKESPDAVEFRLRTEAQLRVMLDTGLRISDVAKLSRAQVSETGDVLLTMKKTSEPLITKVSRQTLALLKKLPVSNDYFWWNSTATYLSAINAIDGAIRSVAKIAKVEGARAHRFRDTFAVRILDTGASMETLQLLLGHKDIQTTQRHYVHFSKGRQQMVTDALNRLHSVAPQSSLDAQHDRARNPQSNLRPFPAARKKAS